MEGDRNDKTESGMSDSKGHEPCETTEPHGTSRHALIKCRFDDDTDCKFVLLQAGKVAWVNQEQVRVLSETDKGSFTVPV